MDELFRTRVRDSDIQAVARLVSESGVFTQAEIAIAQELVAEHLSKGAENSGYHFLFADGLDGLEGYACFGPIPGTIRRWELYWIVVSHSARRSGLGSRLQRATEEAVRAMGGVLLIAETSTLPAYIGARGFYLAQGYSRLAEVPDWHDDGDSLVIFGKRL